MCHWNGTKVAPSAFWLVSKVEPDKACRPARFVSSVGGIRVWIEQDARVCSVVCNEYR